MQKANRTYTCSKCGEVILKGSLYNYQHATVNSKSVSYHYCLKCEHKKANISWYNHMEILAFKHMDNTEKAFVLSYRTGKTITNKDIARTKHRLGVK